MESSIGAHFDSVDQEASQPMRPYVRQSFADPGGTISPRRAKRVCMVMMEWIWSI